jgi:NAD+ synthase (glutamine-hydrolysing)
VYALSRYYNEAVFGREVIPLQTLNVVPSAELNESQDVTKGQGDPLHYPYHDHLFRAWVEGVPYRMTAQDCVDAYKNGLLAEILGISQGFLDEIFPTQDNFVRDINFWWGLYRGMGVVKRVQAPPVIALHERTFGFDHREHIGPSRF